jgi:hypothetical protein
MASRKDDVVGRVPLSRRSFVKRLLAGSFAIPIVSSFALAKTAAAGEWDGLRNPAGHYPGWYFIYPGAANPAGHVPPGWRRANRTRGRRRRGGRDDDD